MPKKSTPNYAGMTKEQQYAAIEGAETVEQLDAAWAAWEAIGYSPDGLLRAAVLERKRSLGAVLSPVEQAQVATAAVKRAHGAALPPITGRQGPE